MIRRTIVALVSTLALVVTASVAASAPAYAAGARDTNITTTAKPDRPVAKNTTVRLTGKLRYKNGGWRPFTGRVVTVHFDPAGAAKSRKVATVKTNRTGGYSSKVTATRSGTWTVRYAGKARSYQSDRASVSVCVYTAGRWQCPVARNNRDLDCKDIRKTVWVGSKDYHRLDADDDGWGCDSY